MKQTPPRYVSPEAATDGRVTVRLFAPNAKKITVEGAWDNWKPQPLTRGSDGLWSATLGPLAPDLYEYRFTVDGLQMLDPKNPALRPFTSRVEVTGGASNLLWQPQDTPRGSVQAMPYFSKGLALARRAHVYTPPGYEESKDRYPVLFLLHGSGDDDSHWSSGLGRANVILDNLLHNKQIPPMIMVMPDGHLRAPEKTFPPDAFERELTEELLPLIDRRFRTNTSRSICGLSMGGGQTVTAGMAHPELFSSFGIFSAGIWQNSEALFEKAITTLEKANSEPPHLIWIGIGKDDFLYTHCEALKKRLSEAHLPFTYVESEGGHVWHLWRSHLAQFAPLAFLPRKEGR